MNACASASGKAFHFFLIKYYKSFTFQYGMKKVHMNWTWCFKYITALREGSQSGATKICLRKLPRSNERLHIALWNSVWVSSITTLCVSGQAPFLGDVPSSFRWIANLPFRRSLVLGKYKRVVSFRLRTKNCASHVCRKCLIDVYWKLKSCGMCVRGPDTGEAERFWIFFIDDKPRCFQCTPENLCSIKWQQVCVWSPLYLHVVFTITRKIYIRHCSAGMRSALPEGTSYESALQGTMRVLFD